MRHENGNVVLLHDGLWKIPLAIDEQDTDPDAQQSGLMRILH